MELCWISYWNINYCTCTFLYRVKYLLSIHIWLDIFSLYWGDMFLSFYPFSQLSLASPILMVLCSGDSVALYINSKNLRMVSWKWSSIAVVDTPPLHCLTAPVLVTTGTIWWSLWVSLGCGTAEMDCWTSIRPVHMCQALLVLLKVRCCGAWMKWMSSSISSMRLFFYI